MHLDGRLGPRGRGWQILCVPYPEWKLLHNAGPVRPGHCDAQQIPAPSLPMHAHAWTRQEVYTALGVQAGDSVPEVAWVSTNMA